MISGSGHLYQLGAGEAVYPDAVSCAAVWDKREGVCNGSYRANTSRMLGQVLRSVLSQFWSIAARCPHPVAWLATATIARTGSCH